MIAPSSCLGKKEAIESDIINIRKDGKETFMTRKRHSYTDSWLSISVAVLTVFSTIMIGSANISSHDKVMMDVSLAVIKQIVFILISLAMYFIALRLFSFKRVRTWVVFALYVEGAALLATRFFGSVGGAYAWFQLPFGVTIQPSEFAKILIILTIATFMCDIRSKKIEKASALTRIPLTVMIIYGIIIVGWQSDLGSGFAFLAIGCICFLLPGHKRLKKTQFTVLILMLLVVVATMFFMSRTFEQFLLSEGVQQWLEGDGKLQHFLSRISYQFYRFISAGDPLWDRFGYSQELLNSLLGFTRGNIRGVGLGNSIQKFGYLASADADYIFPVIVEELGLLGIALVVVPYSIIYGALIRYALRVPTEKEKVVLIGTAAYLFVHMFLNIGGVSALIPLTGVPLLLVSRGGTSLMSIFILLGFCQNIIRGYNKSQDEDSSW
ncbi:MAG: FtsW/RodA/SpoVE family cell cycle protein [Erysipelotrichaceae bacterium]|nr:FtsW/RodA/SpoVE family cell cycle protein [Erysipelotrichaceae bacterium]